jgi:outer membrane lipoprotein SlyB
MKLFSLVLSAMLVLSGCARQMGANTYTSGSAGGVVLEGTIVSARAVTIKDADKLQDNALGGLAGGALGGVGASGIGKGSGSAAATVGGAIVGAVAGALIQDELGTSQGMEYIVKLAKGSEAPAEKTSSVRYTRETTVQDKMRNSIKTQNTSSNLISVIQGKDVIYTPGQHVYIVYSDDRPRITAATN